MKQFLFILCFLSSVSFAQQLEGSWHGILSVQGMNLRLDFNIVKKDSSYSATMDSPDQSAFGIPMTSVTYANQQLVLTLDAAKIVYTARLENDV
ncbi:MAG: alpha/beta hydrolase, partial [Crocinitomicaceae bacterium]|nr:alpha/beta hydrolase [Crocinitomicaceae bacterium]